MKDVESQFSSMLPKKSSSACVWDRHFSLLLTGLCVLVYLPVVWNGYIWDDDHHIYANAVLTGWDGLWRIWSDVHSLPQYYPLVHTTFWLEYRLWGTWPTGYHLVNVLLHAASGCLIARIGDRLHLKGSRLAAFLFVLHPVCVESVAWASERKNVLSLFFALAAFVPLYRSLLRFSWRHFVIGSVLFLAAMGSKTVACSLPAVLVLVIWWRYPELWWRRWRRLLMQLTPLFLIGAGLGLLTVHLEAVHVGAGQDRFLQLSWIERVLTAMNAVAFYLRKLCWPVELAFFYPRWNPAALGWPQWGSLLSLVVAAGILLALPEKRGRGALVALLCYCGILVPALGFFKVYPHRYSFVADHFQYHAMVVFCLFAAHVFTFLTGYLRLRQVVGIALAMGCLTILGCLTWSRVPVFRNPYTLYTDTLRKNPDCWAAWNNLGIWFWHRGNIDEAIQCFSRVLAIRADHHRARIQLARLYAQQQRCRLAQRELLRILRLRNLQLGLDALSLVGDTFRICKAFPQALKAYRMVLLHQPGNGQVWLASGDVFLELREYPRAIQAYQQALKHTPVAMHSAIRKRLRQARALLNTSSP
ncbi:MAG: tetratricopeptide repeat protein [Lentisphaerae bacterium]|nr:MAG: tetratricopeptide repeat protein [Lentisphaerota bacterium]